MSELLTSREGAVVGILLGGERLSCCDEAVVLSAHRKIIAAATLSPDGETGGGGAPALVGMYVLPAYRREGHGLRLMLAALERCRQRGWANVHIELMSSGITRIVDGLPAEERDMLVCRRHGPLLDPLVILARLQDDPACAS